MNNHSEKNRGDSSSNSLLRHSLKEKPFFRFLGLRGEWFILILIIIISIVFRFHGLKEFSQVGGDDIEFRVNVPGHVELFEKILKRQGYRFPRLKAPFLAAVCLSHWDVNKKVTSFAKPFFLLELGLLQAIFDLSSPNVYEDIWKLHQWMAWLGVLTVVVVFFLGKRLGGSFAGLIAAFLVAVSPWAVRYSTWGLHVAGGGLWFVLAVLAATRLESRDTFSGNILSGALTSICVYYSTSMIWPALFLMLFELIRRIYSAVESSSRARSQILLLAAFLIGFLLPLLVWELINLGVCHYLNDSVRYIPRFPTLYFLDLSGSYVSFPRRLVQTIRDNAAHTGTLPVDQIFFWRHLKDSEGWIVLGAVAASVAAGIFLVAFKRSSNGTAILRLLFVFFGVACVMNYTAGTQVARHYFSAGLVGFVLAGMMTARLRIRGTTMGYILPLLALFVALLHFDHLQAYRRSRQGPYLVEKWERENDLAGQTATMSMQQWDVWPTMTFLHNWNEFNKFCQIRDRPHIMHSDYIGIAHGSWFYHNVPLLEMAETFDRCEEIVFSTDSYLSYKPMLYENEFYYWGLFRNPSPYFDPRIKVIPAGEVIKASQKIKADAAYQRELLARLDKDAPIVIPAWRRWIRLPYMDRMHRPSYLVQGIISSVLLLAFTLFSLRPTKLQKPSATTSFS